MDPTEANPHADTTVTAEAPVRYAIDPRRFSIKNYLVVTGRKPRLLLAAIVTKLTGRGMIFSLDDPCVDRLGTFEVAEADVPRDFTTWIGPVRREFERLGFATPIFHSINDRLNRTQTDLATFRHGSGQAFGRIHCRIWTQVHPPRKSLFLEYATAMSDGTFVWSLSSKRGMGESGSARTVRETGAMPAALWEKHRAALAERGAGQQIRSITDQNGVRLAAEALHAGVVDHYVRRGIWRPYSQVQQATVNAQAAADTALNSQGVQHAEVIAELERPQTRRGNVLMAAIVLAVSLGLFALTGRQYGSVQNLLLVMGILFVHESGHYLAMKVFGYSNVTMFFIPFFGAAVAGRKYNVAGWKRAVVALMGPVPSIVLGIIVGLCGLVFHKPLLVQLAFLAEVLNGLNLLPVVPLDGGKVVQSLFFSRNYVLDVGFSVVAAGLLIAASFYWSIKVLLYVGIALLLGVPATLRLSRIASELRQTGVATDSGDNQTIPRQTADQIIGKLKATSGRSVPNRTLAMQTRQVFEAINARPPGWAATIGLAGVQFVSLAAAVVFAAVFFVGSRGGLAGLTMRALGPKHHVQATEISELRGYQGGEKQGATIVATFSSAAKAQSAMESLRQGMPSMGRADLFGESVLLGLPARDAPDRQMWLGKFKSLGAQAFVEDADFQCHMQIQCQAPTAEQATEIDDEISQAFIIAEGRLLVPWDPADPRTAAQKAKDQLARQTLLKMQHAGRNFAADPAAQAYFRQIEAARQQGDSDEVRRLRAEIKQERLAARQREFDAIRTSPPDQADQAVVQAYLAIEKAFPNPENDYDKRLAREKADLSPLLGAYPEPATQPAGATPAKTQWAYATTVGTTLTISVSVQNVLDEAPEIARWLAANGCSDMRYDFFGHAAHDDDEDDVP